MSASALKSSMQGVGSSPTTPGHSILPMNVVAQKVVPGTESSASMKPLTNSGMSYTMLQPPNQQQAQPLSLVQDHRSQVYQNQSYANNNTTTTGPAATTTTSITSTTATSTTQAITTAGVTTTATTTTTTSTTTVIDKDAAGKTMTNGVDTTSVVNNSDIITGQTKQNQDTNKNNNSSLENTSVNTTQQQGCQKQNDNSSIVSESSGALQITKLDESTKAPVNNGSKVLEALQSIVLPSSTSLTITSVNKLNEQNDDKKIISDSPQKSSATTSPTATTTTQLAKQDNENLPITTVKIEQKIATTPRVTQKRKSRETKDLKTNSDGGKPKRTRVQTQPYQSPLPEIALIVKETMKKTTSTKNPDDKLIVFYKNEFLAVRNSEGSFYVCQAMQNIYKSSRRIRIRWLSQDKNNGEIYSPDFYDFTDFDCILTNLNLNKIDKNKYQLTKIELLRTENILKRAIDVEAGVSEKPSVTEEHPDGLDLSLYKDESQLKRRKRSKGKESNSNKSPKRQRKRSRQDDSSSSSDDDDDDDDNDEDDDESSSSDEDEKKTNPKVNRAKRTTNKELALAKSLVKVPSRANRALLRGARTNTVVEDNTNSPKKQDTKKQTITKATPSPTTSPSKNPTSPTTSPTSATTSTATSPSTRTKLRGSTPANDTEKTNNSTTGRAKRTASTSAVSPTENSSTRKKSQGST